MNRPQGARRRKQRQRLLEAQGNRCAICGHPIGEKPTTDHVYPQSRAMGLPGNKVAVHRKCNHRKADREPTGCELIWLTVVTAKGCFEPRNGRRLA